MSIVRWRWTTSRSRAVSSISSAGNREVSRRRMRVGESWFSTFSPHAVYNDNLTIVALSLDLASYPNTDGPEILRLDTATAAAFYRLCCHSVKTRYVEPTAGSEAERGNQRGVDL